jgi:hypothetical protein
MISGYRLCVACLLALGMGAGCTSVPEPAAASLPQRRLKHFKTQSGDQVTLYWDSQAGTTYTVIYNNDPGGPGRRWRVLPGFEPIRGSGGKMNISFTAPASGRVYYRIKRVKP